MMQPQEPVPGYSYNCTSGDTTLGNSDGEGLGHLEGKILQLLDQYLGPPTKTTQMTASVGQPSVMDFHSPFIGNGMSNALADQGLIAPFLGSALQHQARAVQSQRSRTPERWPDYSSCGNDYNACGTQACGFEASTPPDSPAKIRPTFCDTPAKVFPSNGKPECMQEVKASGKNVQGILNIQAARETAAAGGGLSGCMTVMVQQIPCDYTQNHLMDEISTQGFEGKYDFFSLPHNARNPRNRGFAFINFRAACWAEAFYNRYHGKKFQLFDASKPVTVIPADVQGFEQNVARFFASWQVHNKKRHTGAFKPVPGQARKQGRRRNRSDNQTSSTSSGGSRSTTVPSSPC